MSDNRALGSVGDQYLEETIVTDSAPLVVHERTMTNHVWLKSPIDAPDLPRQRVIADCAAALEPNDDLWDRYLSEIEQLREEEDIDEQEYVLLRSDPAKRRLVEITGNRAEAFVTGQYPEILEHATEEAVAEEREEKEEIERSLQEEKRWRFETKTNIRRAARGVARAVSQLVAVCIVLLVVAFGLAVFFGNELSSVASPLREIIAAAATLIPLLSAADIAFGLVFGTRLGGQMRKWESRLARNVEDKLTEWFLPSS